MEFETYYYFIFLGAGFLSGFVDSIAGGGGIISVPVLLASGMPPHIALATNKLQSSFGSFTASANYIKKGLVSIKDVYMGIIFTFIGACLGTYSILLLNADLLSKIIPIMLVLIFLYTFFTPKIGKEDRHHILKPNLFYFIFGISLGFYDGFFGPGTGSFWTIAIVMLLGLNLKSATAQTKIMNFTSNVVSLGVFIIGGQVLWTVGILMGIGQILGAYTGSTLVVKKDVTFIRVFFLSIVGITILKLLYDSYLAN
ncbi:TSUP family transporter [Sulfurospirillum arcachonense]|uniref:TSUP family transporter n=1 Tax=Sulfurospirillum arcachonense TaxID=57666 RepID=UPI00046850FB|nr:TSUP family transporter [Sulfurospirillum arcachonense]